MTKTTYEQRRAIARRAAEAGISYRKLRRLAQPTIGCGGAIALPWCGMWLCIETDGTYHS